MLGEISSGKTSELKAKRRLEAIEVLGDLCRNMEGVDLYEQWKIRRHYYLYSGQHLQNRSLGYEEIKRGNQLGLLSVGFRCLHHATELVAANKLKEAQKYAVEGEEAFEKLLEIDPPKHGRLLAYALLLALQDKKRDAVEATDKAASMLGINSDQLHEHNEEMTKHLSLSELQE